MKMLSLSIFFILIGVLLLVILPVNNAQVSAAQPYCTGSYAINREHCDVFNFSRSKSTSSSSSTICSIPFDILASGNEFPDTEYWPMVSASKYTERMARRITSTFENGSDQPQYDYVENLNDQRGYTAGMVGFTTATGDVLMVVERYTQERPDNALASFLPELRRLSMPDQCDAQRSNVHGLAGFPTAWREAARNDSLFHAVQARAAHDLCFEPALKFARKAGVHSPLGIAIFYDTVVQHGWHLTEPEINIQRILSLTTENDRKDGGQSEVDYLNDFLHVRRRMLCCYPDNTWPESAGRVADLQSLLQSGNTDLSSPVSLLAFNTILKDVDDERIRVKHKHRNNSTTSHRHHYHHPLDSSRKNTTRISTND